jgi:hypothetical protein
MRRKHNTRERRAQLGSIYGGIESRRNPGPFYDFPVKKNPGHNKKEEGEKNK